MISAMQVKPQKLLVIFSLVVHLVSCQQQQQQYHHQQQQQQHVHQYQPHPHHVVPSPYVLPPQQAGHPSFYSQRIGSIPSPKDMAQKRLASSPVWPSSNNLWAGIPHGSSSNWKTWGARQPVINQEGPIPQRSGHPSQSGGPYIPQRNNVQSSLPASYEAIYDDEEIEEEEEDEHEEAPSQYKRHVPSSPYGNSFQGGVQHSPHHPQVHHVPQHSYSSVEVEEEEEEEEAPAYQIPNHFRAQVPVYHPSQQSPFNPQTHHFQPQQQQQQHPQQNFHHPQPQQSHPAFHGGYPQPQFKHQPQFRHQQQPHVMGHNGNSFGPPRSIQYSSIAGSPPVSTHTGFPTTFQQGHQGQAFPPSAFASQPNFPQIPRFPKKPEPNPASIYEPASFEREETANFNKNGFNKNFPVSVQIDPANQIVHLGQQYHTRENFETPTPPGAHNFVEEEDDDDHEESSDEASERVRHVGPRPGSRRPQPGFRSPKPVHNVPYQPNPYYKRRPQKAPVPTGGFYPSRGTPVSSPPEEEEEEEEVEEDEDVQVGEPETRIRTPLQNDFVPGNVFPPSEDYKDKRTIGPEVIDREYDEFNEEYEDSSKGHETDESFAHTDGGKDKNKYVQVDYRKPISVIYDKKPEHEEKSYGTDYGNIETYSGGFESDKYDPEQYARDSQRHRAPYEEQDEVQSGYGGDRGYRPPRREEEERIRAYRNEDDRDDEEEEEEERDPDDNEEGYYVPQAAREKDGEKEEEGEEEEEEDGRYMRHYENDSPDYGRYRGREEPRQYEEPRGRPEHHYEERERQRPEYEFRERDSREEEDEPEEHRGRRRPDYEFRERNSREEDDEEEEERHPEEYRGREDPRQQEHYREDPRQQEHYREGPGSGEHYREDPREQEHYREDPRQREHYREDPREREEYSEREAPRSHEEYSEEPRSQEEYREREDPRRQEDYRSSSREDPRERYSEESEDGRHYSPSSREEQYSEESRPDDRYRGRQSYETVDEEDEDVRRPRYQEVAVEEEVEEEEPSNWRRGMRKQ